MILGAQRNIHSEDLSEELTSAPETKIILETDLDPETSNSEGLRKYQEEKSKQRKKRSPINYKTPPLNTILNSQSNQPLYLTPSLSISSPVNSPQLSPIGSPIISPVVSPVTSPRVAFSFSKQVEESHIESASALLSLASPINSPKDNVSPGEKVVSKQPKSNNRVKIDEPPIIKERHERVRNTKRETMVVDDELKKKKTTRIAKEIYESEKTYLSFIQIALSAYLKRMIDLGINKTETIEKLYTYLSEVMSVNIKFLSALKKRIKNWQNDQRLSDIFLNFASSFQVYIQYCDYYDQVQKYISHKIHSSTSFREFLAKTQTEFNVQDLNSLLIMPIQRIPRYTLLLSQMLEHTSPDNGDYGLLKELLSQLETITVEANKQIQQRKNAEKLADFFKSFVGPCPNLPPRSDRMFLWEGYLTKICRKRDQKKWFILLDDTLIYGVKEFGSFLPSAIIPLTTFYVNSLPDEEKRKNLFQIITSYKSFSVYTDVLSDKISFLNAYEKVLPSSDSVNPLLEEDDDDLDSPFQNLNYGESNENETNVIMGEQVLNRERGTTLAPVWMPDSVSSNCLICGSSFNFTHRRHHCRKCGILVCSKCSTRKLKLSNRQEMIGASTHIINDQQQFGAKLGGSTSQELQPSTRESLFLESDLSSASVPNFNSFSGENEGVSSQSSMSDSNEKKGRARLITLRAKKTTPESVWQNQNPNLYYSQAKLVCRVCDNCYLASVQSCTNPHSLRSVSSDSPTTTTTTTTTTISTIISSSISSSSSSHFGTSSNSSSPSSSSTNLTRFFNLEDGITDELSTQTNKITLTQSEIIFVQSNETTQPLEFRTPIIISSETSITDVKRRRSRMNVSLQRSLSATPSSPNSFNFTLQSPSLSSLSSSNSEQFTTSTTPTTPTNTTPTTPSPSLSPNISPRPNLSPSASRKGFRIPSSHYRKQIGKKDHQYETLT